MAFKCGFIIMAPDADPAKDRAAIKTPKLELTVVVTPSGDMPRIIGVCQELVRDAGVQDITLCPGFTHGMVARVKEAVGDKVSVCVARGDGPSGKITGEVLAREWWGGGH